MTNIGGIDLVLIKRLSFFGDYLLLMREVQIKQTKLIKGRDFRLVTGSTVVFELDLPTQALLRRPTLTHPEQGNGFLPHLIKRFLPSKPTMLR